MQKAVVLLSGGLDSTTCLAYAKSQGYDCYALIFNYGQRHGIEVSNAFKIAQQFAVPAKQFKIDINQFGGSALTDNNIDVPVYNGSAEIPVTYVPARNTIFLAIALAYAETIKAAAIFIGVSSIDYSHYPDCRPEYYAQFRKLADLATKTGVEGQPIQIITPLINLTKAETIKLGQQLGVDYSQTISCYQANAEGRACGSCDSCVLRQKGFLAAGVADPTPYY